MKRIGGCFNVADKLASGTRAFFAYWFVFFFGFVFAQQQSFALAGEELSANDYTVLLSNRTSHHFTFPFHLPFQSAPTEQEESSDDNEPQEDWNDDWNLFSGSFSAEFFSASVASHLFTQTTAACRYSAAIPFFILYHSWKSFLV
ncbi:MAG: hypothetical protein KIS94_00115 [Chitinophagales bacterium]|nr:hypothetical protein [Chitinophagales bacterium]